MMSVTTTDTADVSDETQYTLDEGEAQDIEMCVDSTATKCVTVSVDAPTDAFPIALSKYL